MPLYRVLSPWTASYATAIALAPGDPILLDGRRDSWEGHAWLWARGPDGREGWIPDTLVAHGTAGPRAARAFDAMELSCTAGEELDGLERTHGWVLCRNDRGEHGWVPERCLGPVGA